MERAQVTATYELKGKLPCSRCWQNTTSMQCLEGSCLQLQKSSAWKTKTADTLSPLAQSVPEDEAKSVVSCANALVMDDVMKQISTANRANV